MNRQNIFFCIILLTLQIGCSSEPTIKDFDFSNILKTKINVAADASYPIKFSICNEIPFNWDYLVILPPYTNNEIVKKHKLINSIQIERRLPELTLNEDICIILFVEKNAIVRCSYVSRRLVDFNNVNYSNKIIDKISKKTLCEDLYLRREKTTLFLSN